MKYRLIFIVLFFLLVLLIVVSFLFKNNQKEIDMGDGFYFIPYKEITFDVTAFEGNGVFIYKDSLLVPVIFPHINHYKFDSSFIIVKQDFNAEQTKTLLENMIFHPVYFRYYKDWVPLNQRFVESAPDYGDSKSEGKYIENIMKEDSDIIRMVNNKVNYYIINKLELKVLGPFSQIEFKNQLKELNISDNLKFE